MRDFNHSVNVLIKAYMNDTLVNGHPCGCAVGNLLADSSGKTVSKVVDKIRGSKVIMAAWDGDTDGGWDWYRLLHNSGPSYDERVTTAWDQINQSGYTSIELLFIEKAFETHRFNCDIDEDTKIYKGLILVIDILAEIHNVDLTTKDKAKAKFISK